MADKKEDVSGFFSKNFNVINFLIQGGILITILTFVFKSGVYYEQMTYLLHKVTEMSTAIEVINNRSIDSEKKIQEMEKDYILLESNDNKLKQNVIDIEKCQANKKYCR